MRVIESNSLAKIKLAHLASQPDSQVAIKVFCKTTLRSKKEYVRRADGKGMEIHTQLDKVMSHEVKAIIKAQSHPNIVRLFEIIDTEDTLMLVMEFCELGSLILWQEEAGLFKPAAWVGQKNGLVDEEPIRMCIRDAAIGLKHLHDHGIMHRDIKPQNLLLNKSNVAKLVDFGVSHVLASPGDSDLVKATEGTYHFMSPEECDPESAKFGAKAIDVWALGVTLFCMLFNRTPFHGETEFAIMEAVRTEPVVVPGDDVRQISPEIRALLMCLLEKDCKKRVTADELVTQPWLMR